MSDDTADVESRGLELLRHALRETKFIENPPQDSWGRSSAPPLGGASGYWEEVDGDIRIVMHSALFMGGRMQVVFRPKDFVLTTFMDVEDPLSALIDCLADFYTQIELLLPRMNNDLLHRRLKMIDASKLGGDGPDLLEQAEHLLITPLSEEIGTRLRKSRKKLRAEPVGAGRPKGSKKPPSEIQHEADLFAQQVIDAIRARFRQGGDPTKTQIANDVGIVGVNYSTGTNSILNRFTNKLKRLTLDYKELKRRAIFTINSK